MQRGSGVGRASFALLLRGFSLFNAIPCHVVSTIKFVSWPHCFVSFLRFEFPYVQWRMQRNVYKKFRVESLIEFFCNNLKKKLFQKLQKSFSHMYHFPHCCWAIFAQPNWLATETIEKKCFYWFFCVFESLANRKKNYLQICSACKGTRANQVKSMRVASSVQSFHTSTNIHLYYFFFLHTSWDRFWPSLMRRTQACKLLWRLRTPTHDIFPTKMWFERECAWKIETTQRAFSQPT